MVRFESDPQPEQTIEYEAFIQLDEVLAEQGQKVRMEGLSHIDIRHLILVGDEARAVADNDMETVIDIMHYRARRDNSLIWFDVTVSTFGDNVGQRIAQDYRLAGFPQEGKTLLIKKTAHITDTIPEQPVVEPFPRYAFNWLDEQQDYETLRRMETDMLQITEDDVELFRRLLATI